MFQLILLFFGLGIHTQSLGSITMPELKFLEEVSVNPAKLKLEGDSIRFTVKGTIPIESAITSRNARLKLVYFYEDHQVEFEEIPLVRNLGFFEFEKKVSLAYEDWMLYANLELWYFQGKKDATAPLEKKQLAKGLVAPQLMVKLGEVYPDEPIPSVGLYITTGQLDREMIQRGEFFLNYDLGSSQVKRSTANQKVLSAIDKFLQENPTVQSVKITGIQSPEAGEGKAGSLAKERSQSALQSIEGLVLAVPDSLISQGARFNDWFDLRLLLRDYAGISTVRKEELYAVLMNEESFSQQFDRLRKVPGFNQVQSDLFPKLRTAKIEIVAKPRIGLDMAQSQKLQEALKNKEGGSMLTFAEWSLAAEVSNSLDEKAAIYGKMTEYFRSPAPYNNIAVVRMRQAQRTLDIQSKEILWEEAERLLNQALKIEVNPYSQHNMGQLLALKRNYWNAYKWLSEASVGIQNPELTRANESLRGALDILRGDYKLATLRFDYTFTDPKDYFNKGLAFFMIGDYAKATMAFEESVILGRNFGYGYYGLAMIASLSGQQEIALIQLKKAISSNKQLAERAYTDPIFQEMRESPDFFTGLGEK